MKSLKIFLRRSMAIALLSIPMEALAVDDRRIALAFDDGPLPGGTEALIKELEKLDIKATFFPADREMERFPAQPAPFIETGPTPGHHGEAHSNLLEMGTPAAGREIAGTAKILQELGYRDTLALHPPFGLPQPMTQEPEEGGSAVARWDLPPESNATMEDPQAIADYIVDNAFPGAVILMHPVYNQREQVLRALPLISTKLRAKGYRFATVSELLAENSTEHAVSDL